MLHQDFIQSKKELQDPFYLMDQLKPVIFKYPLRSENKYMTTELALTSYLMGMGYDCETAQDIVDLWHSNHVC